MNAWKRFFAVFGRILSPRFLTACAVGLVLLASVSRARAQASIVSVTPATGASGVSATSSVVFTFSEPMDTNVTSAQFYTSIATPPYAYYYTNSASWNAASNILTCAPVPSFTAGAIVAWTVSGNAADGKSLKAPRSGHFTIASDSTGAGTNAVTAFVVERADIYDQNTAGQPTADTVEPFLFIATTSLASNVAATNVALTLPNATVTNLEQSPGALENWVFGTFNTNASILDATYSSGSYTFTVEGVASNQTVWVDFPASLAQPPAPHVNNFAALQGVDSTQPITLQWDAFAGGTSADSIMATVATVWQSPNPGASNALNGTATSVTIPAGTLAPGQTYTASVGFAHAIVNSNANYTTTAYRVTDTKFALITAATSAAGSIVLTNALWNGGVLGFDVLNASGQTVTVISAGSLAAPPGSWSVLQTFTNPGTLFHFSDLRPATNPGTFYRARAGN